MPAFNPSPVTVRRGPRGDVVVGADPPRGVTAQSVVLAGATLVVDLTDPSAIPHATVTDPELASWWLSFVYGPDVADLVTELAALEPADAADELRRTATAVAGDLAGPLLRFATGLWLYQWWPLPDSEVTVPELSEDDERALECELGVLAWFADEAFGGTSVARSVLEPNVDFIDAQAVSAADGRLPAARVLAITRAALQTVSLDDATFTRLDNLESTLEDRVVSTQAVENQRSVLSRAWAAVRDVVTPAPESAWVAMGAHDGGTATVEWGRVPPRTLSSAEDNVEWTFSAPRGHASGTLEVRVPVHPGSRAVEGAFSAAVYSPGELIPEVVVELLEVEVGADHALVGAAEFERAALPRGTDPLRVVVSCAGYASPGLRGATAAGSADQRALVAQTVNRLVEQRPEWGDQAGWAAYDVDPRAPWFRLAPSEG